MGDEARSLEFLAKLSEVERSLATFLKREWPSTIAIKDTMQRTFKNVCLGSYYALQREVLSVVPMANIGTLVPMANNPAPKVLKSPRFAMFSKVLTL